MAIVTKRTVMTLYSDPRDIYSHQVRIVLAEKGVNVEIKDLLPGEESEDLLQINPYYSVPTLIDRELVLYEARIIMEYLDERFPHPPLLPVYPVARAESRKMMFRIEHDWYSLMREIVSNTGENPVFSILTSKADNMLEKSDGSITGVPTQRLVTSMPQTGNALSTKSLSVAVKELDERVSAIKLLKQTFVPIISLKLIPPSKKLSKGNVPDVPLLGT